MTHDDKIGMTTLGALLERAPSLESAEVHGINIESAAQFWRVIGAPTLPDVRFTWRVSLDVRCDLATALGIIENLSTGG